MKQDFFEIGKIVKTHGIHGELIIEVRNPEFIENIKESVFLEIDGILVPFFIAEIKTRGAERARVKFDWVDSETQAKKLNSCSVFASSKDITISDIDFENNFDLLKGFIVSDTIYGELGTIDYIIESDSNPLISVTYKEQEILIPIHPDLIKKFNQQQKTILIECPKGLIDIYFE